jgi:hypothetical protein
MLLLEISQTRTRRDCAANASSDEGRSVVAPNCSLRKLAPVNVIAIQVLGRLLGQQTKRKRLECL